MNGTIGAKERTAIDGASIRMAAYRNGLNHTAPLTDFELVSLFVEVLEIADTLRLHGVTVQMVTPDWQADVELWEQFDSFELMILSLILVNQVPKIEREQRSGLATSVINGRWAGQTAQTLRSWISSVGGIKTAAAALPNAPSARDVKGIYVDVMTLNFCTQLQRLPKLGTLDGKALGYGQPVLLVGLKQADGIIDIFDVDIGSKVARNKIEKLAINAWKKNVQSGVLS